MGLNGGPGPVTGIRMGPIFRCLYWGLSFMKVLEYLVPWRTPKWNLDEKTPALHISGTVAALQGQSSEGIDMADSLMALWLTHV